LRKKEEAAEAQALEELIGPKTTLLYEKTQKINLNPIKISISLGNFREYIIRFQPQYRLRIKDVNPEPTQKEFIKILDYLLEEIDDD
jgi:hypothetical protein